MSRYQAHLEVVELDARIVPSTTKGHALVQASVSSTALRAAVTQTQLSLSGTGSGVVGFSPAHVIGGGTLYVLRGTANLTGLGQVTVTGGLTLFSRGTASGTLILANARGSVSLKLTANNQSGQFSYQVISSSIAALTSQGILTLTLSGGRFTLVI